jgi:hypothetical protein
LIFEQAERGQVDFCDFSSYALAFSPFFHCRSPSRLFTYLHESSSKMKPLFQRITSKPYQGEKKRLAPFALPFKPVEGRRPVMILAGFTVQQGTTLGGEGPYNGSGGGNETLPHGGLPAGSARKWELLPTEEDIKRRQAGK